METGFLLPIVCVVTLVVPLLVIGIVCAVSKVRKPKTQGVIHVDYSDPIDGPYLFLELKVPVADIVSKKRVMLDVDTTKYYSHE